MLGHAHSLAVSCDGSSPSLLSSGPFGLEGAGLGLEGAVLGVVLSQSLPSSSPSELEGLVPGVPGTAFFGAFQLFPVPFHRSHSLAPLLLLGLVTRIPPILPFFSPCGVGFWAAIGLPTNFWGSAPIPTCPSPHLTFRTTSSGIRGKEVG